MPKHREEHANVKVAQALNWLLGKECVFAETKGRQDKKLFDFDVRLNDLHIVMEAKYQDRGAVEEAAVARFDTNPQPDAVGAILYTLEYQEDAVAAVKNGVKIDYAFKGKEYIDSDWQWRTGSVYDLADALRRPGAIVNPDVNEIEQAAHMIQGSLVDFAGYFDDKPAVVDKVAETLQIPLSCDKKKRKAQLTEAVKVGGLIIIGALLFQFVLSNKNRDVKSPNEIKSISELMEHWDFILNKINYVAVFAIAKKILEASNASMESVKKLINVARDIQEISQSGADLMGRIYHRLLADAKTLAAYYTSIPAASIVAGLSLADDLDGDPRRWADLDFIRSLRIVDPACGSGTLLSAACWQIKENFARALFKDHVENYGGAAALGDSTREVHRILMEGGIWGYDILETPVHLTATTLGLMSPEVDFKKTHLYRTIIGKGEGRVAVGSLEMLEHNAPLFGRNTQVENNASDSSEWLSSVDLCIMNPPYVRGTVGNEMFDFLPDEEQRAVKIRLKNLGKIHGFRTDKGQGPAFVSLACQTRDEYDFIKPGGRLAVILPATAVAGAGDAWKKMRKKIEKNFTLETVIVSRDANRPNFSENTNLQECVIIARKRKIKERIKKTAMFVVLNRNPSSTKQALNVTQAIRNAQKGKKRSGELIANMGGGGAKPN